MENYSLVMVEWSKYRDKIKIHIDNIGSKANDHELYTNIDKACSNEWAFLFLATDGFVILRPRHQQQTHYIDVSAAYCDSGNALLKYQQHIINLASCGNAKYIEFYTVRKGFNRIAPKYKWQYSGKYQHFVIWRYYL